MEIEPLLRHPFPLSIEVSLNEPNDPILFFWTGNIRLTCNSENFRSPAEVRVIGKGAFPKDVNSIYRRLSLGSNVLIRVYTYSYTHRICIFDPNI